MTRLALMAWSVTAAFAVGCVPGSGGGGGGDCREASDACSAGFTCVAVAGGSSYACRATCDDDDDCLRDERCGGEGLCVDRPPVIDEDAAADEAVAPLPGDAERPVRVVDAEPPVRIIDAGPPPEDSGVVVIPEPDAGPGDDRCNAPVVPIDHQLMALELTLFEDFPIFFEARIEPVGGGAFMMSIQPLTTNDSAPTGIVATWADPVATDGEGRFATGPLEVIVPPTANQLGGELIIVLELSGAVHGSGVLCGDAEGELLAPPLGVFPTSRFMTRAWDGDDSPRFPACEACLP